MAASLAGVIVCCGEALIDVFDGIGVESGNDGSPTAPGGGPMNAAVAAARLGAPAAFVGRVSTDPHGERIWRHLQANGVDVRTAERGPEPTARAVITHDPDSEAGPAFRFEGDNTADTALEAADLSALGTGPHVLLGGTLGMFRGRTAEVLARLAERNEGIVALDPNVRPAIIDDRARWNHFHQRWLAVADIYRASDEDLSWIWPGRSPEDCAAELLDPANPTTNAAVVAVTKGARGACLYTHDGSVEIAAPRVEVADTVGAGDAFVGSMLTSVWNQAGAERNLLRELDLTDWRAIARRATTAAAITCTRPGANPPTAAELEAAIA